MSKQITTNTKLKPAKMIRVSDEIYEYLASQGTCHDSFSDVLEKILKERIVK